MAQGHQRGKLSINTASVPIHSHDEPNEVDSFESRIASILDTNATEEAEYDDCDDVSSLGNDEEYLVIRNGRGSNAKDPQLLQLEQDLQKRGTTVKFDAVAHLEDGNEHELDAPLPKPSQNVPDHRVLAIPIRTRPRRHSETETEDYDSTTGERLESEGTQHAVSRRTAYATGQSRYPLVQSTVDELAHEPRYAKQHSSKNATVNDRTFSTPGNGEARAISRSAILTSPVQYSPLSYISQDTTLPSRRSVSQRSFGSLGSVGRRHQARSNASSLTSPAHSFLSQWTRGDVATKEPEPDDEGQEIGGNSGYIIGRKIGYGGFSVVKEATTIYNAHKIVRAVKIVRKQIQHRSEEENERLQSEFEREVGIWRYLKHRHVLPLIAVYDTSFATFCITKLNQGGTLFDLIRARRKLASDGDGQQGLPAKLAQRYLYQLASALRYLHEDVRVVHRDIKPENCLVDMSGPFAEREGGDILLCDFGMADFIHNDHRPESTLRNGSSNGSSDNHSLKSRQPVVDNAVAANIGSAMSSTNIQGSLEYAAPELLSLSEAVYSTAVDMWAYGCVAYVLLTGKLPFTDEFKPRLSAMIQKGDYDIQALEKSLAVHESSSTVVDLVKGCLTTDPADRFHISGVLQHKWLHGCKELYDMADDD